MTSSDTGWIEAQLSEDPAPLAALTNVGDAFDVLAAAACWHRACLDEGPEAVTRRLRLLHTMAHDQDTLHRFMSLPKPRDRKQLYRDWRIPRLALIGDALASVIPGRAANERFDEQWEVRTWGLHTMPEPPVDDRFYRDFYWDNVAPTQPHDLIRLDVLDLRRASPPAIRVGISASAASAGAAAVASGQLLPGVVAIFFGLVEAVIALRLQLADLREREAASRAAIARDKLEEHVFRIAEEELERHPAVAELVLATALPAALKLTEASVATLIIGDASDQTPG